MRWMLLALPLFLGAWSSQPRVLAEPDFRSEFGPGVYPTAGQEDGAIVCSMHSPRCSDGRKITTERATSVPCETSPGVWEMVGPDEGCYSVRGLESWAANTSYLSFGAELDRAPWSPAEGAQITGRILTGPEGTARLIQTGIPGANGPHTLACRMRAIEGNSVRLRVTGATGGSIVPLSVSPDWSTVSATWNLSGDPTALAAHIYPDGSTLEIAGCWLTRSATPGRACWGGEALVTCDADTHVVSTEGWPTESGEISLLVRVGDTDFVPVIIDGRAPTGDVGPLLNVATSGSNVLRWRSDSATLTVLDAIERHRTHHIVAGRSGGKLYLVIDGVRHEGPEAPPLGWQGEAILGRGRVTPTFQGINGSIRSLTVRSFE